MSVYAYSMTGRRPQNEDKHKIILNDRKQKSSALNDINFYAVFDGHGGKHVSEFLNNHLYKYFIQKKVKYPLSKTYVNKVYDHLQNRLRNSHKNFSYHCGSTALVVIKYKKGNNYFLNILNTGDCRCVLSRGSLSIPLTSDHKPDYIEERIRIENLGGVIEFDDYDFRIKGLSVSRAFGDIDATPYVTHLPYIGQFKLEKSDRFLVIACDGLWDVVENHIVTDFVLKRCYKNDLKTRKNKKLDIARELAKFAIEKGSTDNVSVIVVFFDN